VEFFLHSAWVIAALPLATAALIAMFGGLLRRQAWVVGTASMFISFLWSVFAFIALVSGGEAEVATEHAVNFLTHPAWHSDFDWATVGSFVVKMGVQVDGLTGVMLMVVTLVSFCVQMYASAYFEPTERRVPRFYAAINLFTTAMLGLVLADNLFLLFVCWEIMGLCSYLLIGHWYEKEWPKMGQIKAFLTTRVGDVGMMIGMFILFMLAKTLTWEGLAHTLPEVAKAHPAMLGLAALLLFTGAMGKSAQFPLHTWLPDAMAGPTPGSALIHAATMVAAGVYLVGRGYMVFGNAPEWALAFVAFIGAFTSIFAASIASLRWDIKEVLAYSTISQLGYMIMALGVGGWAAGNFHMMTHAFFKALLFFGAGSIIHAHHHNQLMHKMGGLRKKIPITFAVWMVGYLALAGFPGFSGFFSKDELLLAAWTWENSAVADWALHIPFYMGLTTAFLTAYYMTRTTYLTFFGKPRDLHLYDHAHESPWQMWLPMAILAVPAALVGWFWAALPHEFIGANFMLSLEHLFHLPGAREVPASSAHLITGLATTFGLSGIFIGWLFYAVIKPETRATWIVALKPIYTVVRNKYYVDEFYDLIAVKTTVAASKVIAWFDGAVVDGIVNYVGTIGNAMATASGWFDANVVDKLVTMWADIARSIASSLRRVSTGYVQQYMLTFVVVIVAGVLLFQVIGK
jgi:NADH-quinone oxidoreductase subunit L